MEFVSELSLTSHSTQNRSFRGRETKKGKRTREKEKKEREYTLFSPISQRQNERKKEEKKEKIKRKGERKRDTTRQNNVHCRGHLTKPLCLRTDIKQTFSV